MRRPCQSMQPRESRAHQRHPVNWPFRCELDSTEERPMVMFKRSQIYIGLGLAAVVELVIRVVVH